MEFSVKKMANYCRKRLRETDGQHRQSRRVIGERYVYKQALEVLNRASDPGTAKETFCVRVSEIYFDAKNEIKKKTRSTGASDADLLHHGNLSAAVDLLSQINETPKKPTQ